MQQRNWQDLNRFFRKLPALKKFQHFVLDKNFPSVVSCKERSDSEPVIYHIGKLGVEEDTLKSYLPDVLVPPGLDRKRQIYLYEKIRQFCEPGTEDKCCPKPLDYTEGLVRDIDDEARVEHEMPPPKRRRQNQNK